MKKWLSIVAFTCFYLNAAYASKNSIDITEQLTTGKGVEEVNGNPYIKLHGKTKVTFSLPANETTGCKWYIGLNDEDVAIKMFYGDDASKKSPKKGTPKNEPVDDEPAIVGAPAFQNFVLELKPHRKYDLSFIVVYADYASILQRKAVTLSVS